MSADGPCELLAWDSEFFGFPVARVCGDGLRDAAAVDQWCERNHVACLYFLAHPDQLMVAQAAGFRLFDVRMVYEYSVSGVPAASGHGVRSVVSDDLPDLERIAATRFHDSRFYQDANFP